MTRRWTGRAPLPDPALAELLWQATVGAWPIERDRLLGYARKAAREASTSTGWADPDPAFEAALRAMVDAIYDDPVLYADLAAFTAGITPVTMPGVPDVYQGTELWDHSLVDPDNRRPVDFAIRRDLLARLDAGWRPPVDASGAVKLLVTSRALRLRRERPFTGYARLAADGPAADHAVAFDRYGVVTVVTRLPVGLRRRGGWGDTGLALPAGGWTDVLTGRHLAGPVARLADLLAVYPVALLAKEQAVPPARALPH